MGGALQKPLRPVGALFNQTTRAIGFVSRSTLNAALFVPRLAIMRLPKRKSISKPVAAAPRDKESDADADEMWMLVGLGNPGAKYDGELGH